jgi:hypothetical protein
MSPVQPALPVPTPDSDDDNDIQPEVEAAMTKLTSDDTLALPGCGSQWIHRSRRTLNRTSVLLHQLMPNFLSARSIIAQTSELQRGLVIQDRDELAGTLSRC